MTDSKDDADFDKTVKSAREKLEKVRTMMDKKIKKTVREPLPLSKFGGWGPSTGPYSSGIPMKFPYTFTAKLVQFPWKFYWCNNWIWTYYFAAVLLCIPIFKKISNVVNSEANVKKWEELKKAEAAKHH